MRSILPNGKRRGNKPTIAPQPFRGTRQLARATVLFVIWKCHFYRVFDGSSIFPPPSNPIPTAGLNHHPPPSHYISGFAKANKPDMN